MIPGWGAAAAALQAVLGCAAPEPSADVAARRAMAAAAGSRVMPFDLDAKVHVFEKTGSGGIQQVVAETRDPRQTALVREHLEVEAGRFARGDFHDPAIRPGDSSICASFSWNPCTYRAFGTGMTLASPSGRL